MKELFYTPLFAIMISFVTFQIGIMINRKTRMGFLNPLLISIVLVIIVLKYFNISQAVYDKGGQYISFFLTPATVVLAVPLYKKLNLLKAYLVPILAGIFLGTISGIVSVIGLCYILKIPKILSVTLIPKSITTPIGIEVSKQLGGITSITVAAIVLTGILGAIIGPYILKLFRVWDKVAVGVAFGTASHAAGTSKAIEIGDTEGAMSSLSIGIAGVITVFIAPVIANVMYKYLG